MALDRITLADFRNHCATRLDETAKFNLLVGENGAGKTNVLEALSMLAPGRGLRRAALTELSSQTGPGGFALSAELVGGVRLGTAIRADRPTRRIVQINGAEASAASLAEWLSLSWLTPAMDRLFAEGAGARRRFLDRMVLALEPGHARQAAEYENALRERNRLLSDQAEPDPAWLDALESQLAAAGGAVAAARARLVSQLAQTLDELPEAPFARPELVYQPGGPIEPDELARALAQGRRRDRAAQRTLEGPHRDELAVTMVGKGQAAAESSTGEQKAMLITITLAHAAMQNHDRPRVLLLDEVAAHLDPIRRATLFERLREGAAQVWLTGTELAPFDGIAQDAAIWQVNSGAVERLR